MIKKIISFLILLSIFALSMWCLVFKAYYDVRGEVDYRLSLGDRLGALESLKSYQKTMLSYPVYNNSYLEKFRFRLMYLEGVAYNEVGKYATASALFRKTVDAQETVIAAASKYNLALAAIKENALEKAQFLFNEALMLNPDDIESKINLELALKKIQAQKKGETPDEPEKQDPIKPEPEPGEQWRLDVPDEEGEGSGASSGRSFL